jgi:hypothetical protein
MLKRHLKAGMDGSQTHLPLLRSGTTILKFVSAGV